MVEEPEALASVGERRSPASSHTSGQAGQESVVTTTVLSNRCQRPAVLSASGLRAVARPLFPSMFHPEEACKSQCRYLARHSPHGEAKTAVGTNSLRSAWTARPFLPPPKCPLPPG